MPPESPSSASSNAAAAAKRRSAMILPPMSSISPSLQQKTFNPAAATAAAAGQGQGSPKLFHNRWEELPELFLTRRSLILEDLS